MDILNYIKISFFSLVFLSCESRIEQISHQNFDAIIIKNCPDSTFIPKNIQYSIFKKGSNFQEKICDYYSFSVVPFMENAQRCFSVIPNFDNSFEVNGDIKIILDNDYYYRFEVDTIMYDTIRRPTVLPMVYKLYIYRKTEAKVNDSIYKFNNGSKWILPFNLVKRK